MRHFKPRVDGVCGTSKRFEPRLWTFDWTTARGGDAGRDVVEWRARTFTEIHAPVPQTAALLPAARQRLACMDRDRGERVLPRLYAQPPSA